MHEAAQELAPVHRERDGLERNLPKDFATVVANCLAHGRRKFVEVAGSFPDECRFVLETLRDVCRHDDEARAGESTGASPRGMPAPQRLPARTD